MDREMDYYRKLALELGGDAGRHLLELADEFEHLQQIVKGLKLPRLYGKKEVADELEIDPKNMHHKMRTKDFPLPDGSVGGRMIWIRESIMTYKEQLNNRKRSI